MPSLTGNLSLRSKLKSSEGTIKIVRLCTTGQGTLNLTPDPGVTIQIKIFMYKTRFIVEIMITDLEFFKHQTAHAPRSKVDILEFIYFWRSLIGCRYHVVLSEAVIGWFFHLLGIKICVKNISFIIYLLRLFFNISYFFFWGGGLVLLYNIAA